MKSPTSRTTLITIAAVVGVLTAGTAAIAANIGILNATTSGPIGALSATDDLVQTTPPEANIQAMVEVPITTETTTTTEPEPESTEAPGSSYVVDEAGAVTVMATPDGVVLLNMVANPGWTVVPAQTDPMTLTVTFDNGSRTVVFTASLGADGEIVADVTEPVVVVAPQPPRTSTSTQSATTGSSSYHDDDHSDDHSDDHETHSYEGGGDDD